MIIAFAKFLRFSAVILLAWCGFATLPLHARGTNVVAFFTNNCAACHGLNLQGGSAPSLLTGTWRHGSDDESIARVIREGDLEKGMPAWKAALSDADIRAMVVLLREKIARAQSETNLVAKPIEGEVVASAEHAFRFKTITEDLETPWSIAFLPDDRMLVTELPGRLRIIDHGQLRPQVVTGTPAVRARGQGGMLAVATHPQFKDNGWIYLSFSDPATKGTTEVAMTAVVRGRIRGNEWTNEETIFRAPRESYLPTAHHYGCRLTFDGQGHLFFSIGERGKAPMAQDLSVPNGKVHRVRDDGRIPADNPFVGRSNAVPSIWSYGNRNPQGLFFHAPSQRLWQTEHGARGGDELNLIRAGANYGWPVITYGMDYNGTPISALTAQEGMEQPVLHWTPSIAVGSVILYGGQRFPRWRDNLLVASLAQQELRRLVLSGERVVRQEVLFRNLGRVRDVAVDPDGLIYVALNKPDKIIRLDPVN
jgi:glucose/arabinose dehydrogenase